MKSTRGFTLVEIMVASALLLIAMTGILYVYAQAMNTYAYEQGRLIVNQDIRKLTQQMTSDAVFSSYFRLYTSFQDRSDNGSYNGSVDAPVTDGGSGDFVVFFTETTDSSGKPAISQLVAYYRDAPAPSTVGGVLVSTPGPVRRVAVTISPAIDPTSTTMLSILNTYLPVASQSTNPMVVQLAQGLANGSLFYNFYNRSVMVRGQIQENGSLYQRAASTYNFTLSPRG